MNRMRHHHAAKAVTAASALLLLGWFGIPSGDAGSPASANVFEGPQDAGVIEAGTADGAPTPPAGCTAPCPCLTSHSRSR